VRELLDQKAALENELEELQKCSIMDEDFEL